MFLKIATALLLMSPMSAGLAEDSKGSAAGEVSAPAHKVLVIARIKEEAKRRQLEEQARVELQEKGVGTTLGSDVLVEADFASEDIIRKKVESLDVDGVLGFAVLGVEEKAKASPTVSVGVGVPVSAGPFSIFVGGSVPIGGGQPKVVRIVHVRARYFARPFAAPAWEKIYDEKLKEDTTGLTQFLAQDSVKALKKKKLIPAK
jgi:hypothetical protein